MPLASKQISRNDDDERRWRELVAQSQQGDKRAYNTFLAEIFPFIINTVRPGLQNDDWAEEIAQEVLLSVHKSLHTYDNNRPLKPWLRSIIHFRKADLLRRHYGRKDDKKISLDAADFETDYVTDPAFAGELKDIEAGLGILSDRQREIVRLARIEGYSIEEIANRIEMSASAVKVTIHRSLKKIRTFLD